MATVDRAFRFAASASGSGDKDTLAETLADHQHVMVAVWNYSTEPVLGGVVFIKDGGAEVNLTLVRGYSRTGNSDRAGFFFLRNAVAGSYVIRAKNLPYCGISAVIIDADVNCQVYATTNTAGAGEGTATGLNLTSPSLTPRYSETIAFGVMTHNVDGSPDPADSVLSADTTGGWAFPVGSDAVPHQQPDYDGASQPGAAQYKELHSVSSVTSTFGIAAASVAYLSQVMMVTDFPEVYRIMGGTEQTGWFGNDNSGGADATDAVVHPTFFPKDQLVVRGFSFYNYTPVDASIISDDGSNTWTLRSKVAHNDLGAHNDGSWTFYDSLLANDCTTLNLDTSTVIGSDAKWGQSMVWVIKNPDTVNGIVTTTPVIRSQSLVTTIDPTNGGANPLTPTTTKVLAIWGFTNRDHSDNLLPKVVSDARFTSDLWHTQIDVVTDIDGPGPAVYGSIHNSYTQSGTGLAALIEDGLPISPTLQFTGPGPISSRTHSVMVMYNILGGTPVGGGGGGTVHNIFHSGVFGRRIIRRAA